MIVGRPKIRSALCCLLVAACNDPAIDLREWTPADHSHGAAPAVEASQKPHPVSNEATHDIPGLDALTLAVWRKDCVGCHGRFGQGDGPQGKTLGATDLSKPSWQDRASDERIAQTIRRGRNRMPAFDLPEPTLQNLVKLVRLLKAETGAPPAAPPSTGSPLGAPTAPMLGSRP